MSNTDKKDPLQTEVSEELQVLRKMRKYTEKYTNAYIVKNMLRLEAYSTTEMGRTPGGTAVDLQEKQ